MTKTKKLLSTKGLLLCGFLLLCDLVSTTMSAQESNEGSCPRLHAKHQGSYWYTGAELFSPYYFGDLYSISDKKFCFGVGGQLKLGHQFSPIFAIELNAGYGQNSALASGYQQTYVLGMHDAYVYYPYTMIDGIVYTPVKDIFGEQGINSNEISLKGIGLDKIRSDVRMIQTSINAVLNLNGLFSLSAARYDQPVVLLLKPGLYLSHFSSTIVDASTDKKVAPKVNQDLTFGLGGDLSLRFNLSSKWGLELTNRLVWERDRAIDGVLSAKRAYDDFTWQPAVGLVYKFGKTVKPRYSTRQVAPVPKVIPKPEYMIIYPEATAEIVPKQRAHSATISLSYPLNKTNIEPGLANNKAELARIEGELQRLQDDSDLTIRGIMIDGYASPEGDLNHNLRLAEGRAQSLIEYVMQRSELSRSLFRLGTTGENWEGLKETVSASSLPNKSAILVILSGADVNVRKAEMKRVAGYAELLRDVYPSLRLSKYTVSYDIRGFHPNEAKERIKTDPTSLSPEEIYTVAQLYPKGSPQRVEALEVLDKLYGDSDLARTLRGLNRLESGMYDQAIRNLTQVKQKTTVVINALGIAHAERGDNESARRYFDSISDKSDIAKSNLSQLNKYIQAQR
ncbi:hypothetical protein [Porphyromonas sp.]|uniref:hypothetical protein n=1 Tax=Porphyromonas sp. TaxID=1924944 RepID=UPI0026DBA453|nr:hypothetical protein [Porphyromonas sp.]MDO4770765.1 hypothetical protein [Porphyromonas sp.]